MRTSLPIAFAALSATLSAQTFEVASIKLHPPPWVFSSDPRPEGNRVVATASTLQDMLTVAYGVRYDQIAGIADWMRSEHYDVAAKAEGDAPITVEQMRSMLQAMLAERFHLKIHRETKDVPMYDLVIDKGGPKLREVPADTGRANSMTRGSGLTMRLTEEKGTMAQLARRLAGNGAERPVNDKTGLTAFYAYKLEFTRGNGTDSDLPNLVTALREQLGLKLESTKGPVEFIVVDHAEKPTEN